MTTTGLAKKLSEFLWSFVCSIFVDDENGQLEQYQQPAYDGLVELFETHKFTLPDKPTNVGKNARNVSANKDERFYVFVEKPDCACPLALAPLYSSGVFLRWVVGPDTELVTEIDQMIEYHLAFSPDLMAKSRNEIRVRIVTDSARQAFSDKRNKLRNKAKSVSDNLVAQNKLASNVASMFIGMPEEIWATQRNRVLSMADIIGGTKKNPIVVTGKMIAEYVDNVRANGTDSE